MAYIASWYWDKGRFREKNEDSFSLQRVMRNGTELVFLAVCDGIGGLPEGECASGFAAERLTEWFYREAGVCMEGIFWRRRMKKLVRKAFYDIQGGLERCEREEDICCGTTCTMALVKNGRFLLAHMGDSRAYRIGAGEGLFESCFADCSGSRDCYRRLKGIGGFVAAQGEKDNMTAVFVRYEGRKSGDARAADRRKI